MLCKDTKQHHVMFHELNSVSSLLCIAQNVRFEIPYKDLYFETPFLMIFKYYAWASYGNFTLNCMVWFQKISIPHPRGTLQILRGRGMLKAKILKGKYELNLEFPEGWGAQIKKILLSGTTHCTGTLEGIFLMR